MGCASCGGANCGGAGCGPEFHKVTGGTGVTENALQRPLTAGTTELCGTLAFNLIGVADSIRDLYTTFGLRPYRVNLVRTYWSGGVRGKGTEIVATNIPILPTPLLTDMSALTELNSAIGLDETGEVLVSQISGSFTEDQLRGHIFDGQEVPADQQFYYEVEFPPACRGDEGARRRFTLKGAPMYFSDRFQWNIRLEKQRFDRARDGTPR